MSTVGRRAWNSVRASVNFTREYSVAQGGKALCLPAPLALADDQIKRTAAAIDVQQNLLIVYRQCPGKAIHIGYPLPVNGGNYIAGAEATACGGRIGIESSHDNSVDIVCLGKLCTL